MEITAKRRIKDLPLSERPYERCESEGVSALSEAELLAIVLQTGTKTESAVGLAERLDRKSVV